MRTKRSLINMIVGSISQIVLLCLNFFSRKIFIQILSVEYLGCDGIFSNVLHIFTFVGCGAPAVSYILVQAIATKNEDEIKKAFSLVRYYQLCSCGAILVVGIAASFLTKLFSNTTLFSWQFLQIVYFVFLVDLLLAMWGGMANTPGRYDCVIKSSQRQAICSLLNCTIKIVITILQISVLWLSHSYILYLAVGTFSKILYILFTRQLCFRYYPYLRNPIQLSREYIKSKNLFRELRSNFYITLSVVIFGNTDNIILASFCGIAVAGIYSNYYLLYSQLCNFVGKFLDGLSASVGNFVNAVSENHYRLETFYKIQSLSAMIASLCAIGFWNTSENLISKFFGEIYLLNTSVCLCLSIMIFLAAYGEAMAIFRHSVGRYWKDQWFQIVAAIANLGLSLLLVSRMSISGILIGTMVGIVIQTAGHIRVVKELILPQLNVVNWLIYTLIWGGATAISCVISLMLLNDIPYSFNGIIIRAFITFIAWIITCVVMTIISKKARNTMYYGVAILKQIINNMKRCFQKGQ